MSKKCIKKNCEREAFDKDGYCKKHGWERICNEYFGSNEWNNALQVVSIKSTRMMLKPKGKEVITNIIKKASKEAIKNG